MNKSSFDDKFDPGLIKTNWLNGTYVVLFVLDIIVWHVLYHLSIVRVQIVKIGLYVVFVTKSEAQWGKNQKGKNKQLHCRTDRLGRLGDSLNLLSKEAPSV